MRPAKRNATIAASVVYAGNMCMLLFHTRFVFGIYNNLSKYDTKQPNDNNELTAFKRAF